MLERVEIISSRPPRYNPFTFLKEWVDPGPGARSTRKTHCQFAHCQFVLYRLYLKSTDNEIQTRQKITTSTKI